MLQPNIIFRIFFSAFLYNLGTFPPNLHDFLLWLAWSHQHFFLRLNLNALRVQKQKVYIFHLTCAMSLALLQNGISFECIACVTSHSLVFIVFGTKRKQKLKHTDRKIYTNQFAQQTDLSMYWRTHKHSQTAAYIY